VIHKNQIQQLLLLRPEEKLGKELQIRRDSCMTHSEYIYLKLHSKDFSIEELTSPSARGVQKSITEQYQKYSATGLTEEDFFPKGADIVVEQLLRFIDIPEHAHQFYEFVYVVTGSCVHMIDGKRFEQRAGSFSVIPPSVPHVLYPAEDCLCLTTKIRYRCFYELDLPDLIRFMYPMVFSCGEDPLPANYLLDMYAQQEKKGVYHEKLISLIFQTLILYILQHYQTQGQLLTANSAKDIRIMEILNYAVNRYNTVTVHEIAQHFHYNDSYFSDLFHRLTGVTFIQALRKFRLTKAAELLQETNLSVTDICSTVGYKDATQFIRYFKMQYGCSPASYRNSKHLDAAAERE